LTNVPGLLSDKENMKTFVILFPLLMILSGCDDSGATAPSTLESDLVTQKWKYHHGNLKIKDVDESEWIIDFSGFSYDTTVNSFYFKASYANDQGQWDTPGFARANITIVGEGLNYIWLEDNTSVDCSADTTLACDQSPNGTALGPASDTPMDFKPDGGYMRFCINATCGYYEPQE
jgi:hypothetical protein